jgi:putative transposase
METMVNYRRNKLDSPHAVYFLTILAKDRLRLFSSDQSLALVRQAMQTISERYSIQFKAWVIMPEHIHWLIKPVHADYSKVIFSFKRGLSPELKKLNNLSHDQQVWHNRFWEHTIKDDNDLNRCTDYIHFNPVKHGLVKSPIDWEYSSFRKYVEKGLYEPDWAAGGNIIVNGAEWDIY